MEESNRRQHGRMPDRLDAPPSCLLARESVTARVAALAGCSQHKAPSASARAEERKSKAQKDERMVCLAFSLWTYLFLLDAEPFIREGGDSIKKRTAN